MIDDLAIPGRYPEVAASLEADLDAGRGAPADLHARLAVLDPVGAARMEPTNRRRVVRALEVTLGAGRPFSEFGPGLEAYPSTGVPQVGLALVARGGRPAHRGALRRHGRRRAGRRGPGPGGPAGGLSRTARQALGYREILAHVEGGAPLDECLGDAVRRTRQFARRQASWFRRDPRIAWAAGPDVATALLGGALSVHG